MGGAQSNFNPGSSASCCFNSLSFNLLVREGVTPQSYGATEYKTPDTGQMKPEQFISHKLTAPREEDIVLWRDTEGTEGTTGDCGRFIKRLGSPWFQREDTIGLELERN